MNILRYFIILIVFLFNTFGVFSQDTGKPHGFSGDAENLVFKIQIAACVEALPLSTLRNIYPREVKITNEMDNGWYKYMVGNYKTYRDAWEAQQQMKIEGSFIVAYRKGKRLKNIREVAQPIEK